MKTTQEKLYEIARIGSDRIRSIPKKSHDGREWETVITVLCGGDPDLVEQIKKSRYL